MPSRLSSLLVRDGLVGVKRMGKAFQRQVIYGGSLDTILLEMNLVPEERLQQYLSLATGLPPATTADLSTFDAEAVRSCPKVVAEKFGVAPLSFDGDSLRVLVHEPIDFARLEELASEIDLPIQPLITPEYRFHVTFDRAYGITGLARYAALAKRSQGAGGPTPVGKAASVIIEAEAPPAADARIDETPARVVIDVGTLPARPHSTTLELSTDALKREIAAHEAARRQTERHVAQPAPGPTSRESAGEMRVVDDEDHLFPGPPTSKVKVDAFADTMLSLPPAAVAAAPAAAATVAATVAATATAAPPTAQRVVAPSPVAAAVAEPAFGSGPLVVAPATPAEATELLAAATHRDEIFGALLRAIRARAWYAGLLTVQGAVAIGRLAIAGNEVDRTRIGQVLIPLDVRSPFKQVVDSASPYIGPIATGNPDIDGMVARMSGVVPPAALLLPIVLRHRVVAIAVGHRGADAIAVAEVSEVLPLASVAAEAFSRLILEAKRSGYRPALESGPIPVEEAESAPKRPPSRAAPRAMSELLDLIEDDRDDADAATAEVVRRPADAIEAIGRRFPGRLSVDRYELGGRALRPERHGPLLGLVVKLGPVVAGLLVAKMRDGNRDTRYYATLCAAALRPKSALGELAERLFDVDYGVRNVALEALAGYPTRELTTALAAVRSGLGSPDLQRVHAAASALADLADVGSVAVLIDTLGAGGPRAESARGALVVLAKQDFGTTARRWRSWWTRNRDRHRIEWLIDGLDHKNVALRQSAIDDLRRVTGEFFGYVAQAPRRDRDDARKRWAQWWSQTGSVQFARGAPRSHGRDTDLLPGRGPSDGRDTP
jgi:hypothetical protein